MRLSNLKPLFWVGVAGAASIAAALFLQAPERRAFDARLGMRADAGWPSDLVMVAIDDPTLNQYGRWPWPREDLGRFVESVKGLGAKTILLDVVLAAPSNPASDAALAASFERSRPILGTGISMVSGAEGIPPALRNALAPLVAEPGSAVSADHLVIPMGPFAAAAGGLGHAVYFPNERDGQVRAHVPFLAVGDGALPSTALVAWLAQNGAKAKDVTLTREALTLPTGTRVRMQGGAFYLDLVPHGVRPSTISAKEILNAKDPKAQAALRLALGGKLALIYVDSVYTPDLFSSPVAPRTTGGSLIAYAIRTFTNGRTPRTFPLFPVLAVAVLIGLAAARRLASQPPGIILGAAAGAAVAYALLACALVRVADLFIPVTAPSFFFLAAGALVTGYAGRVAEVEKTQMRALLDSVKRAYAQGGDDRGTVKRPMVDLPTRPGAAVEPAALATPATNPRAHAPSTGSRGVEIGVGTETRRGSAAVGSTKSGAERLVGGQPLEEPVEIGQYEVQRSLGRGGMGAIFLAIDRDLDRPVAIKILESVNKDTYIRFRREAMAVARISHPNVVQVYDVGLDSTVPFIVMEYVAGGTLSDLLRDPDVPNPMPWDRATRIVSGVAKGLGAAHNKGIVHRDMKPANILMVSRKTEFPKLADFGIAKLSGADQLTREGLVVGTVGYLSPEQALGKPVDARSDVYSLGVMYYRMLTGQRAFEGTTEEMLRAGVTRGIPDPREVNPSIPSAIAELVVRMGSLDKEPRPKDGNVVASALDMLLSMPAEKPAARPGVAP